MATNYLGLLALSLLIILALVSFAATVSQDFDSHDRRNLLRLALRSLGRFIRSAGSSADCVRGRGQIGNVGCDSNWRPDAGPTYLNVIGI